MGVATGSELILAEAGPGEWRLSTRAAALGRLRTLVRRHVAPDVSLVDELLSDRRTEGE